MMGQSENQAVNLEDLNHRLMLRNLTANDYDAVADIQNRVYKRAGGADPREVFLRQLQVFPEGQICIEDNGTLLAAAFSIIVDYGKFGDNHTYANITGNGSYDTHNPEGDTLYGLEVAVHPAYQGLRLGRRLYDARKELCENLNLRAIVVGGAFPVTTSMRKQ